MSVPVGWVAGLCQTAAATTMTLGSRGGKADPLPQGTSVQTGPCGSGPWTPCLCLHLSPPLGMDEVWTVLVPATHASPPKYGTGEGLELCVT